MISTDVKLPDQFCVRSGSGSIMYTCISSGRCCFTLQQQIPAFFSKRIIRVWTSLPPSIVSFESLSSFSKSVGNVNLGIHTKYWSLSIYYSSIYFLSSNEFCVLLLLHVSVDYVACKWRYAPFVMLILNKLFRFPIRSEYHPALILVPVPIE